jgi:CRISPR-associated endonuclease/helicase Cas3
MNYYAHSVEGQLKEKWHLLKNHLLKTGELAKKFADKFYSGNIAYLAGLLHDIGKYSIEFQEKLDGTYILKSINNCRVKLEFPFKTYSVIVRYD